MSNRKQQWFRAVIEWKLDSQDEGTRYAYVTKGSSESIAIFAAINCLIVDTSHTLDIGDTIRVISCDPCAYQRKHDELEEIEETRRKPLCGSCEDPACEHPNEHRGSRS